MYCIYLLKEIRVLNLITLQNFQDKLYRSYLNFYILNNVIPVPNKINGLKNRDCYKTNRITLIDITTV